MDKLERKRFVVSPENFARERLKILRDEFTKLQAEHPEFIALNLFGSMSKGTATPESDIDGILFVDLEKVPQDERDPDRTSGWGIAADKFSDRFTKLGLLKVHSFLHHGLGQNKLNERIADILRGLARAGDDRFEQSVIIASDCHWLSQMFTGISVGRGLDKYREYLLRRLQNLGPEGERIWEEIIKRVQRNEHFPSWKEHESPDYLAKASAADSEKYRKLYPQTVADAIKYFVEKKLFRN